MKLTVLALAASSLLVAAPAVAQNRVVDNTAPPCLSGRPVHATIQGAINAAAPGDLILVCAGNYFENVKVTTGNLTLKGQGNAVLRPGNSADHGIDVIATNVTIRGLDVSGFAGASFACGVRVNGSGADISDNRVHANAFGICIQDGLVHRVRYNVVQNNNFGIHMEGTDGSVEVSNNTVRNNIFGIDAFLCKPGVVIDHNAVTDSGLGISAGVPGGPCPGFVISNNTIRGTGGLDSAGIRVFDASGVVTYNSIRDFETGLVLTECDNCTASFNSVSFNGVGLYVIQSNGTTVTRNNVSRSTGFDCVWDGSGVNVLTNNNCGTQDPPGAFD